ncbi:MAG: CapA family protein [Olsenella sp.]|nr:CapA family protein [Olsenella sp.]
MLVAFVAVFVVLRALVFAQPRSEGSGEGGSAPVVSEARSDSRPVEIDLMMIGDILQHSGVFESGQQTDGSYDFDHIFSHIAGELEGQDIKVVNQETILGGDVAEYSGYPAFNGPQEMGDAEAKAGFNVVLRASNHAMDMGYAGIHSELGFWKTKHPDVHVLGAIDVQDPSHGSISDVYVYEKDGFRVALLNYTYGLNDFPDPEGAVSMLEEKHVRQTMSKAKEEADMVVVFPHWGEEYHTEPVDSQRKWEKLFVECGADVIIGGHPHVIEPVETIQLADGRKGVCFWSVGNFVSTQIDDENLVGGLAKVTLRKDSDGTCSVARYSFLPTVTHKGLGANMTTYLLRDYTDGLAATNATAYVSNVTCTPEWANEFAGEVLGSGYNAEDCSLTVDLAKAA